MNPQEAKCWRKPSLIASFVASAAKMNERERERILCKSCFSYSLLITILDIQVDHSVALEILGKKSLTQFICRPRAFL